MRERGITQASLGVVVGRATSYVHGVLSGYLTPTAAFVTTVSHHLGLPRETLFTDRLLEDSERPGVLRVADDARARRARIGRFGRQPAYRLLRERRIRQVDLVTATGRSKGHVSQVLNGSAVPTPSFVDAVSELLDLAPSDLFTAELLEASLVRTRVGPYGAPPSRRIGPYGRQPAYWLLRERGIRQGDLTPALGRAGGHVSSVLNGFIPPDQRFVETLSDVLHLAPSGLFTEEALRASTEVSPRRATSSRQGPTSARRPG
jgi:transcriptional regulator with XRE-family HTH domain